MKILPPGDIFWAEKSSAEQGCFQQLQRITAPIVQSRDASYHCPGIVAGEHVFSLIQETNAKQADLYMSTLKWHLDSSFRYPLVNIQIAIEHGPVEIVGFPIKTGDFPYVWYIPSCLSLVNTH